LASGKVTRCICHSRSFEEIKRVAESNGIETVEELRNRDYCSNGCGICIPYVSLVLQTGRTVLRPDEPQQINASRQ